MLSVSEIKRYLGSGVSLSSEHDAMLTDLEENLVEFFEGQTGR